MQTFDVIVIGAGAMGAATAWQLASRTRHVLLLEQFGQGHDQGSSHGSARIFRLANGDPDYIRLAQKALALWRVLEDESGQSLLSTSGGIDHGDQESIAKIANALTACGVQFERLSQSESNQRWPHMRFDGPVIFQPDAGRINADLTVATLLSQAELHGAQVHFNEKVENIDIASDSATISTLADTYKSQAVVVTSGAWLPTMLKGKVPLPAMRVTQQQPAHFKIANADRSWPCFIHRFATEAMPAAEGGIYGLPAHDGLVKVCQRDWGAIIDPASQRPEIDSGLLSALSAYVAQWLPGADPTPEQVSRCLYTITPDEEFILDRRGPLIVGSACSGHGFKFTPAIGMLLADMALGAERFSTRFSLPA